MTMPSTLPDIDTLEAEMVSAMDVHTAVERRLVKLSLVLIAMRCRAIEPDLDQLEIDDSDQTVGDIIPVVTEALEPIEDDLWTLFGNLGDHNRSMWESYLTAQKVRHSMTGRKLDLRTILNTVEL